jgi:16S rRNA (cytidine1402-2'-O)-methyltransferase
MTSSKAEPGTLHVVPTPLGNLEDITLRALRILAGCDVIMAEDTRRTRKLLDHHGIQARCVSLHRFSEQRKAGHVLEQLEAGRSVALVTDAGTPGVSDPGARLVARVRAAGLPVLPLPGPCAPVTAVSASGWEGPFAFEGYVERRPAARRRQIARIAASDRASVLFEAPTRLASTLRELARQDAGHRILLAREMTKVHEEYRVDSAAGLLESLPQRVRGEITLVVMPAGQASPGPSAGVEAAADAALELAGLGVRLKQASRIVAALCGHGASDVYDVANRRRR